MAWAFLHDRRRVLGRELHRAVLVHVDEVARRHVHAADRDRHVDRLHRHLAVAGGDAAQQQLEAQLADRVDVARRDPQARVPVLLGGVTAGHGEMAVQAVNVPVSVGGMDVAPGELIHMDENGAVKFPAQHAEAVREERQGDAGRRGAPPGASPRGEDGSRGAGGQLRRRLHAEEAVARARSSSTAMS